MPRVNPLIGKWTHLIVLFDQIDVVKGSEYDVQKGTEIYSVTLKNDLLYHEGKWYNG